MNSRIDQFDILSLISKIQKRFDDPGIRGLIGQKNTEEVLSDALRELWTILEILSPEVAPDSQEGEAISQRLASLQYKRSTGAIYPAQNFDGAPRDCAEEKRDSSIKGRDGSIKERDINKEDHGGAREEQDGEMDVPNKETKLQTLVEIMDSKPVTLNHISADLRYLFVSQSYANWLGHDQSEIVGRHITEILPEGIYQASLPYIQRVLSGEVVVFSLSMLAGDRLRHQDITLIPQFDESGLVVAYFSAIKDVTDHRLADEELRQSKMELERRVAWRTMELKAANEALRRSRDYLNMIINSISDPIFVMDREHRLVLVNDAFCRIMGLPHEEIIGKTAHDFSFPRNIADNYWQINEEVFNSSRESVSEEKHEHHLDEPATVLIKRIPINDSDGNRLLVGIIRDITDIKKTQEKIRFQAALSRNQVKFVFCQR